MSLHSNPGETEARSSRGGQSPSALSLLPAPQVSTASLIPTPLASLRFGYRRQTRVISQEGIWTFSGVGGELAPTTLASCFHSQSGAAAASVGPGRAGEAAGRDSEPNLLPYPWPARQAGKTGLSSMLTLCPDWMWLLWDFLIFSFKVDFF